MNEPDRALIVRDDREHDRFVFETHGSVAELVYKLDDDRLIVIHTGVPEPLQGQGVGGQLVSAALARARSESLTIVPWCPYARDWLRRHPDSAATTRIDWDTPPPSR